MTKGRRWTIIIGVVLVLAMCGGLVQACGGGTDPAATISPSTTSTSTSRAAPATTSTTSPAATTSPPLETTAAPADDPATLVADRYGDCLANLRATEPENGLDDDGVVVTASAGGVVLTWRVVVGNTGDVLTVPDGPTEQELAGTGCLS